MAALLIIGIRVVAPLAILRWPFWGGLLAIAADASDVVICDALGGCPLFGGERYHTFDKIFDLYYLSLEFYRTRTWAEVLPRRTASFLFWWRVAGVAAFELTRVRQIIFFAPNIFENFYLIIAGLKQFAPHRIISNRRTVLRILLIAAAPKLVQEYIMHFREFPTWAFIKHGLLRWEG